MKLGYIYVLQNNTYEPHVVKIGLTTRKPDVRAKELYAGHSGVPMPFNIAVAYSVGDSHLAEKILHKRLKAFRINKRREFFRVPPSVASGLVFETCSEVNAGLGLPLPQQFSLSPPLKSMRQERREETLDSDLEGYEGIQAVRVDPRTLKNSPINTSILTKEQLDRVYILKLVLETVYPQSLEKWNEGFTRDKHPEREIRIWECIAKAFTTVDQVNLSSIDQKKEAFSILLHRSSVTTKEVLETITIKHLGKKAAKALLEAYEMKPKPIAVAKNKTQLDSQ